VPRKAVPATVLGTVVRRMIGSKIRVNRENGPVIREWSTAESAHVG